MTFPKDLFVTTGASWAGHYW